jgi:hypothetical protein
MSDHDLPWYVWFLAGFLAGAWPGILIYLHGVYRWKSWLWFRRKNW